MLEVRASTRLYPSEDSNKVIHALGNVIDADIRIESEKVIATSNNRDSLRIIHKQVRTREVLGVLSKILINNLDNDSTWFYLNKQAAYAGVVVICDDARESPLGPIKVEIRSDDINSIIDWLTR